MVAPLRRSDTNARHGSAFHSPLDPIPGLEISKCKSKILGKKNIKIGTFFIPVFVD
jgi:hypothetical protein